MKKSCYKNLVCSECHSFLQPKNDHLICSKCSTVFPIASGIPCFTKGESAWQFHQSYLTERLIEIAKKQGWRASLSEMGKAKADWVEGEGRFPLSCLSSPKGRVLDAGCGWGGLSFWLTREFSEVYALDSQLDGLQFIDVRSSQDGVENIFPVQGNLLSLPFQDGFFDLVLLNGVLEWVATFSSEHPASKLQEIALREMARVLRSDGVLYIAIENRFGLQYFIGYREEHTGLRFISLLPRRLADKYHKYRKGTEFRAWTHSYRSLTGILRRCGFSKTKTFFAFPSYRNCKYAASLEGSQALSFLFQKVLSNRDTLPRKIARAGISAISRVPLIIRALSLFSPSWIVFASQTQAPQFGLKGNDKILPLNTNQNYALAITASERRFNIFVMDDLSGRFKGKYSVPLSEMAEKKIEMSHAILDLIHKLRPSLKMNLPGVSKHIIRKGSIEFTKAVPGKPLDPRELSDVSVVLDLLIDLNRISIDENDIDGVIKLFDVRMRFSELASAHGFSNRIHDFLQRAQILHGDLNKNNILICNDSPKVPVLIDFEHAKVGPAFFNWYDFLLRNFVIYGGQYPIKTKTVLKRCSRLPGNKRAKAMLNQCTIRFLEACGVSLELHGQLIALYMSYLCQDLIVRDSEDIINHLRSINFP